MRKNLAFTLSEILIALGVIGIIAGLCMPIMIRGRQATEASSRFKVAYALLTKSIDDMEASGVSIMPANYTDGRFYGRYIQFHKISKDCGILSKDVQNGDICPGKSKTNPDYVSAGGHIPIPASIYQNGAFVTNNGMLFMISNPGGFRNIKTKENGKDVTIQVPNAILITIDINGKDKKPNRWGYDLFTFELTNNGIIPYGAPGSSESVIPDSDLTTLSKEFSGTDNDEFCQFADRKEHNGLTCAYRAISDEEYFNKAFQGR